MAYNLTYRLINKGTEYEVSGCTGNCFGVVIPNEYKGLPVTSIGYAAFEDCSSLTIVVIGDSVTSIGSSAFSWCTSLTSVVIGDSVKSIGDYAFYECRSLTSVVISDSVTSIGDFAFSSCRSLTSIEIPDSVTSIGSYAFSSCRSLTSVVIGDSVTSIGNYAFSWCTSLTSVVIGDSVTSIGYEAFYECRSLTIYCEAASEPSGWSSSWNSSNRPVVWDCNNNDLASDGYIYVVVDNIRYSIKDGVATVVRQASNIQTANILANITHKGTAYNVTSIDASAFRDCTSLTSVVIPDSVTTIGERAFYYCTSLTSVVIPDSVTSIGNSAFYDCDSLTSIAILAKTPPTIGSYIFSNISETAKFYCYHSAIGAYKTAANWNKYIDKFIADGIGLYFAMSAQAQKKYFVSKDELHQYVQQYLHDNFAVLIAEYLTKN